MFTTFQKKVMASALTCLSITAIGAFIVLIFRLLADFLGLFGTVVAPVVVALILSIILSPLVDFVSRKGRVSAAVACAAVCAAAVAAAAGIGEVVVPKAVSQIGGLCAEIPEAVDYLAHRISEDYPDSREIIQKRVAELKEIASKNFSLDTAVKTLKNVVSTAAVATGGIVAVFSFLAAFAVVPIYLYYMLTSNFDLFGRLEKNLAFMSRDYREDVLFFVKRFSEIMTSFFRGQLLIAVIMGCLYGTGLMLAGVKFGFLLGFAAGILNLVPYLGTMTGLATILPVAMFQSGGGWILTLAALAIFCSVQLVEGYFLTPRIMGDRTGLHPTVIIFSVFFWGIALNGILGMILAIPLSAFIVAAWDRVSVRWFGAKSEDSLSPAD